MEVVCLTNSNYFLVLVTEADPDIVGIRDHNNQHGKKGQYDR